MSEVLCLWSLRPLLTEMLTRLFWPYLFLPAVLIVQLDCRPQSPDVKSKITGFQYLQHLLVEKCNEVGARSTLTFTVPVNDPIFRLETFIHLHSVWLGVQLLLEQTLLRPLHQLSAYFASVSPLLSGWHLTLGLFQSWELSALLVASPCGSGIPEPGLFSPWFGRFFIHLSWCVLDRFRDFWIVTLVH